MGSAGHSIQRGPRILYGFAFLQVTRFWAQAGGTASLRTTQSRLIPMRFQKSNIEGLVHGLSCRISSATNGAA